MKETPQISVIVPVYKVEAYLDRCVQSIVDQTYQNLEIILVDDGSPDRCPEMCDAWAQRDSRIVVIHKENGGLSDARNAGLSAATGEYICFVDSDDWVLPDYLQTLYTAITQNQCDLAACDIQVVFDDDTSAKFAHDKKTSYITAEKALTFLTHGEKVRAVAWNKLYRRTLLQDEKFPVGKFHEDEFFTYRIVAKSGIIAYIDVPLYCYRQRAGSIMSTASVRHLDALDAAMERIAFLKMKYAQLYKRDKLVFCITCLNLYADAATISKEERGLYKDRIKASRAMVKFSTREILQYKPKEMIQIIGSKVCIGMLSQIVRAKRRCIDASFFAKGKKF